MTDKANECKGGEPEKAVLNKFILHISDVKFFRKNKEYDEMYDELQQSFKGKVTIDTIEDMYNQIVKLNKEFPLDFSLRSVVSCLCVMASTAVRGEEAELLEKVKRVMEREKIRIEEIKEKDADEIKRIKAEYEIEELQEKIEKLNAHQKSGPPQMSVLLPNGGTLQTPVSLPKGGPPQTPVPPPKDGSPIELVSLKDLKVNNQGISAQDKSEGIKEIKAVVHTIPERTEEDIDQEWR